MRTLSRIAVVCAVGLGMAHAQVKPAYIGSSTDFMKSAFCRQYKCFLAGSIKVSTEINEVYYKVSGFRGQTYGLDDYLVFFTRMGTTVVRAGLRYPPAQDSVEDGSFALEFFSFVSGVPLQGLSAEKVFRACTSAVRGQSAIYFINKPSYMGFMNASEEIYTMQLANGFGASWFENESPTTRFVTQTGC